MKPKDYIFLILYITLPRVLLREPAVDFMLDFFPQAKYDPFILSTVTYGLLAVIMFVLYYKEIFTSIDYFQTKPFKKIFSIPLWILLDFVVQGTIVEYISIPQNQVMINEGTKHTPLIWTLLIMGITGPMMEEIVYRHILIGQLSKSLPTIFTAILSVICFTAAHIIGREQFIISEALAYLPSALILTFTYLKSNKTILYPMAIHMGLIVSPGY